MQCHDEFKTRISIINIDLTLNFRLADMIQGRQYSLLKVELILLKNIYFINNC